MKAAPPLVPWLANEHGDYSGDPHAPSSFHGPASPTILAKEEERLPKLRASIETNGYRPDEFGDIAGYCLRRGSEVRFDVHGGRHRAACLAALGWTSIPVHLRRRVAPVVGPDSLRDWPFVRNGLLAPDVARQILDRYFEWSGREQIETRSG